MFFILTKLCRVAKFMIIIMLLSAFKLSSCYCSFILYKDQIINMASGRVKTKILSYEAVFSFLLPKWFGRENNRNKEFPIKSSPSKETMHFMQGTPK